MSEAAPSKNVATLSFASPRRVRFVDKISGNDAVLMSFKDPVPCFAILGDAPVAAKRAAATEPHGEELEVDLLILPTLTQGSPLATDRRDAVWMERGDDRDAPPPVFIKARGAELTWRPGRALLQCDSEQAETLLAGVVEFAHYEYELRRIEDEIANTWVQLEQDKALAFEVTTGDLERSAVVGERMNRVLQRRIRFARIEPHLYEAAASLSAGGRKLGDELREKARIEGRLETVDAQLEVFEGVYEMSGQRMGEYRAARQEHMLEWIIIVLLAAEMILLLVQTVWKPGV